MRDDVSGSRERKKIEALGELRVGESEKQGREKFYK